MGRLYFAPSIRVKPELPMHTMKRVLLTIAGAAVLTAPAAQRADAQVLTGLFGAVAGTAAGGYITLSIVVARAQTGHYLHEVRDLFGWTSLPVIVGAATGVTVGIADPNRLWTGFIVGAAGTAVGTGLGAVVGAAISERPEGKWAGAAIGAGAGMALGSLAGIIWPQPDLIPRELRRAAVIPVRITVPF